MAAAVGEDGFKPLETPAPWSGDSVEPLVLMPNPARHSVLARYRLPAPGTAQIQIMDLTGKMILNVSLDYQPTGRGSRELDISSLPPGVYVALLTVKHESGVQKVGTFKLGVVP